MRFLTGFENASHHTVRHYFQSKRNGELAIHDHVLKLVHPVTDLGHWPVITEVTKNAAMLGAAGAVAVKAPTLASSNLNPVASFLQTKVSRAWTFDS